MRDASAHLCLYQAQSFQVEISPALGTLPAALPHGCNCYGLRQHYLLLVIISNIVGCPICYELMFVKCLNSAATLYTLKLLLLPYHYYCHCLYLLMCHSYWTVSFCGVKRGPCLLLDSHVSLVCVALPRGSYIER